MNSREEMTLQIKSANREGQKHSPHNHWSQIWMANMGFDRDGD